MTTTTVKKNDIQKLQRSIVDALEDVKAQDIQVFDTEHLSSLFERVVIASGTSNRQTKALASSVRDSVRDAGFGKPRVEGESNGEWIIVDCGQAVVHIMQPTFRQYYHLEELWGDKPVRLKLGAAKPAQSEAAKASKVGSEAAAKAPSKKTVEPSMRRSSAAKKGVEEAFPSRAALKKAADKAAGVKPASKSPAKRAPAKTTARPASKTVVVKPEVKPATKKVAAKKATVAKKAPAKKAAPRKA